MRISLSDRPAKTIPLPKAVLILGDAVRIGPEIGGESMDFAIGSGDSGRGWAKQQDAGR